MPEKHPLDALVLAGSRAGEADPVARAAGVSCKAFAPAGGRPMIERVAGVLLDHPRIDRIGVALAGGKDFGGDMTDLRRWTQDGRVDVLEPAPSPAGTVASALARQPASRSLLVTTADHALLNAAILDRFLSASEGPGIDTFVALLPVSTLEARYPGLRRTGLAFREDRYSGCNLFRLQPGPGAEAIVSFWKRMQSNRKRPWRMALAVGPRALLAYGLRRLTLQQAFEVIGARAGGRAAPVILDIPEAAIDVDTPGDLELVNRILRAGG